MEHSGSFHFSQPSKAPHASLVTQVRRSPRRRGRFGQCPGPPNQCSFTGAFGTETNTMAEVKKYRGKTYLFLQIYVLTQQQNYVGMSCFSVSAHGGFRGIQICLDRNCIFSSKMGSRRHGMSMPWGCCHGCLWHKWFFFALNCSFDILHQFLQGFYLWLWSRLWLMRLLFFLLIFKSAHRISSVKISLNSSSSNE